MKVLDSYKDKVSNLRDEATRLTRVVMNVNNMIAKGWKPVEFLEITTRGSQNDVLVLFRPGTVVPDMATTIWTGVESPAYNAYVEMLQSDDIVVYEPILV